MSGVMTASGPPVRLAGVGQRERQTVAGQPGPGDDATLTRQHRLKQADRSGFIVLWSRVGHGIESR
jgi:hypothetical protein